MRLWGRRGQAQAVASSAPGRKEGTGSGCCIKRPWGEGGDRVRLLHNTPLGWKERTGSGCCIKRPWGEGGDRLRLLHNTPLGWKERTG